MSFKIPLSLTTPKTFPLNEIVVAPFWDKNIGVRTDPVFILDGEGHFDHVAYRFADEHCKNLLRRVETYINESFSPTSLFIATWYRVVQQNGNPYLVSRANVRSYKE